MWAIHWKLQIKCHLNGFSIEIRTYIDTHTHTHLNRVAQRHCAGGKQIKTAHSIRVHKKTESMYIAMYVIVRYELVYGSSRYTREKWMDALWWLNIITERSDLISKRNHSACVAAAAAAVVIAVSELCSSIIHILAFNRMRVSVCCIEPQIIGTTWIFRCPFILISTRLNFSRLILKSSVVNYVKSETFSTCNRKKNNRRPLMVCLLLLFANTKEHSFFILATKHHLRVAFKEPEKWKKNSNVQYKYLFTIREHAVLM